MTRFIDVLCPRCGGIGNQVDRHNRVVWWCRRCEDEIDDTGYCNDCGHWFSYDANASVPKGEKPCECRCHEKVKK